ncbi:hypothetical protein PVIIG_02213 [Plasmodium vivax India VII]|uniref:Surface protein P113 n=1 Tax=Plasmodium vivax India VII TaxID=1077284 RepID=A0A0J9S619_PLAVI|nr:hypothetical protein PVIIG_02213 [Plasmodium vivax India VII]
MKLPPLCRLPLALVLLCLTSRARCYVHNDVMKFGEENSLKCSQGSLYILHCEVKCVNAKNRIIHRSCIDQVEAKCMGNAKCKYYFDYVVKSRGQSLRNKNEIEIEECVESERNEIKTSTTCLLSNSFLLDETYIQYFFFIKNKNEEPITCRDGRLSVKSAILHSPFCKINLKDITEILKRQCDHSKECVINPYVLQKDALNERDQCYINNSYVSLNVVCTKEGEEQPEESGHKQKRDDDVDETEEGSYDVSADQNKSAIVGEGNDDPESLGEEDELSETNEAVDLIMNSKESFENKIRKAKSILLSQMNEQEVKKNAIFKKLGEELSKMVLQKYEPSDLKDLIEDRYNEMRRSPDQDLYYLYLIDTLEINKMENLDVTALQDQLAILLEEQMGKMNRIEKTINRLRKKYLSIYNKAKNKKVKDIYDEGVDPVLTYDDFAHGNGIITADIFFKYKPAIKPLTFSKSNASEERGSSKKKEYKDLLEMDALDEYNRKKRITDMRNGLMETLKKMYYAKNGIFNNLASCIKSYCYKRPLNLNALSSVLKRNFENLREKKSTDPVAPIVRYLQKKSRRILQKLKALLHLGYQQALDKELEIDERTDKYNALNEKAKEYNLQRLFSESDKLLKKVAMLTSASESADEVFGNQASFFDVYRGEAASEKGVAASQKGGETSEEGEAASQKDVATSEEGGASSEKRDDDEMNPPDEGYESAKEDGENAQDDDSGGNAEPVEGKAGESEDADGVNAGSNKEGEDGESVEEEAAEGEAAPKEEAADGEDAPEEEAEGEDAPKEEAADGEASSKEEETDGEVAPEEAADGEDAPKEEATDGEDAPKEEEAEGEDASKDEEADEGSTDEEEAADGGSTDATAADEAAGGVADQNDVPVKGEDSDGAESDGAEDAATEIRGEAEAGEEAAEQPTGEAVVKGDSEGGASGLETEKKGDDGGSFFQGLSRVLLTVLAILSLEFLL